MGTLARFLSWLMEGTEQQELLAAISAHVSRKAKVLDVGCGYGRYFRVLRDRGYEVTGVEKNTAIREQNKVNGLACLTPEEAIYGGEAYDLILMAHVVEHFPPAELLKFIDGYLKLLKPGGKLAIVTPLQSANFYDDFDHVKPYQPVGFMMVFGGKGDQVQFYSQNRLRLLDLRFRRSPLRPIFYRGLYVKSTTTGILLLAQVLGGLAFRLTFGLVARKDGWIGIFEKA